MANEITIDIHSSGHGHRASTLSLKSRTNLAVQHIFAAAYFSRKSRELEAVNAGRPFGDFCEEIIWNVSSAILFSVTALEADANEIFIDGHINLNEYDKALLDEIWTLIERKAILDKYEMALFLKKKERFDKRSNRTVGLKARQAK